MTVSKTEQHDFQVLPELRFHLQANECSFKKQYAEIYKARLSTSKPILLQMATSRWAKNSVPTRFLADLVMNERCIIAGTLFKDMKLKPSILREIASADTADSTNASNLLSSLDNETLIRLTSEDDRLFLEDEVQRIALRFSSDCQQDKKLTLGNLATGVVVAALGCELESEPGIFQVEDMLFLEPQPINPIRKWSPSANQISPPTCTSFRNSGPWLCCLSGLGFASHSLAQPNYMLSVQLLADWLRCGGQLGESSSQSDNGLGIVRLMILGDSIQTSATTGDATGMHQQARYLTRHTKAESVSAMLFLDEWLATLPFGPGMVVLPESNGNVQPNGISVDLLPGCSDPAVQLLPQQPMNLIALPISLGRCGSYLYSRTNPYSFHVANRHIVATSGQGINDLYRYTELETSCDRMEATLLWGHLAPTCPDTLSGYPLNDQDKLLLSLTSSHNIPNCSPDYPDIYIAGCQPGTKPSWRRAKLRWAEKSSEEQGAVLVSVPRFDQSFCVVLVHLETLDCRVVYFDTLISEMVEN